MSDYLPKEVLEGLAMARRKARQKSTRLKVKVGEEYIAIHRMWENGFAVDAEVAPRLRGLIDIVHGGNHLCQCLIIAAELDGDEMRYEFKRNTQAADRAPLDFYRAPDAPIALLGK